MTQGIAILVAMALAFATTPAGAAPWAFQQRGPATEVRIEQEFRQLAQQYNRALRAGALDRREADRIGRRVAEIDRLGTRYARDGRFNRGERQRLERLIREARFDLQQSARAPRGRQWQDARWRQRW